MVSHSFILFPSLPSWRIALCRGWDVAVHRVPMPGRSDHASTILARLRELGYSGQPTLLALPSAQCLAATIDTASLDRPDRKTLLFQLEEQLPVPAESLVADFIPSESSTLGVCARTDELLPIVQSLESAGVVVQSVTPAALLAMDSLLEQDAPDQLLLLAEDDVVNLLTVRRRALTHWRAVRADANDLARALRLATIDTPSLPVRAVGLAPELLRVIDPAQVVPDESLVTAAAVSGAAILSGKATPLVELRRDALAPSDPLRVHRGALNALLAAAAVFLVAFTLSCLVRGQRYARAEDDAAQQSLDAFATALPGWPAPTNAREVLESELRKRTPGSPAAPPNAPVYSGLEMFHDVLSRFPRDVRCSIETLAFSPTSLEISGRIHSYADADRIAAAARAAGLDVPPPQVRRDTDSRWRFSLRGTREAKPPQVVSLTEGGSRHE